MKLRPDVKDYQQRSFDDAPFIDSGETRSAVECLSSSITRRGSEIVESFRLQHVARRVDVRNVRAGPDATLKTPSPRARRKSFASSSLRYILPLLIARLARERTASCAGRSFGRPAVYRLPNQPRLLNQSRAISVYWPTSMR